jgi:hypothetical protein
MSASRWRSFFRLKAEATRLRAARFGEAGSAMRGFRLQPEEPPFYIQTRTNGDIDQP